MLNVAHDPSDLPEQQDQFNILSGAMTRCRNLRLDQKGIAKTRDGSLKVHQTAIEGPIWWIEEQSGARYAFAGSAIYRNETSFQTEMSERPWSAVKYNSFSDTKQNVFATNGVDRKRIEGAVAYEWGIEPPTTAPTLSVGSATGLTGSYNAKYTYVRKVGSVVVAESNPSPAGDATSLTNQKLNVSVTASVDPQVTHIRLYRTSAGGSAYNFDQDIEIDESSFISSQADGSLGDLLETDHDRPPSGGAFVIGPAYDGTLFMLVDNLLYYCKPKQPEYWPADYFIEVSSLQLPLTTAVFQNGQLYCFSEIEAFYVQGTGNGTFFPLPMKAKTGAQSMRGALSVMGRGIYHTGPDGIYLFSSGSDVKITEDLFEPIFRGEDAQDMPAVEDITSSLMWSYRNHLYFGYTSAGDEFPRNVIVLNMDTNRAAYYRYPFDISAVAQDDQHKRLLVGDSEGFIRQIESGDTQDDGEPVDFEIQGKDFTLQTRKHFPRWNKYDVDASQAEECYGELILGGEVFHTHTITGSRDTRRRLVGEGNGDRVSIRIRGSGPVSIYAAESE